MDGGNILGLYGVQWDAGVDQSTRFPEFTELAEAGLYTEIILENEYLNGSSGSTGFIMVANWHDDNRLLTQEIDYAGSKYLFDDNPAVSTARMPDQLIPKSTP